MYPKDEGKAQRVAFWTAYGQHMMRHRSMRGPKQGWLNYKTGIKHLYFRQDVDARGAWVAIEIQHPDPSLREVYYDQWWELETLLHRSSGAVWNWNRSWSLPSGQEISRIWVQRDGLSLARPGDHPLLFAFFEQHMLALDEIWADAYTLFKDLES